VAYGTRQRSRANDAHAAVEIADYKKKAPRPITGRGAFDVSSLDYPPVPPSVGVPV
jgi:hypothetical protein